MSADLDTTEHDTRDVADSFAILDDLPVRKLDECEVCGAHECRHYCGYDRVMKPCPCEADQAFHESRRFLTRHDRARTR